VIIIGALARVREGSIVRVVAVASLSWLSLDMIVLITIIVVGDSGSAIWVVVGTGVMTTVVGMGEGVLVTPTVKKTEAAMAMV